jgi:hypothetical protein
VLTQRPRAPPRRVEEDAVPNRQPVVARILDLLLIVAIVLVGIGLGAGAPDVSRPDGVKVSTGGESSPLSREDFSGGAPGIRQLTADCDRPAADTGCLPSQELAVRAEAQPRQPGKLASLSPESTPRRDYLTKMTTMMRRRPIDLTSVDPYQASLNPAVYVTGNATPTERGEASAP